MKKGIKILLFIFMSYPTFSSVVIKVDTISLSFDKQIKEAIEKYDNPFYLFPYITVFDKQYLSGKELVNKHGLTDTLTTTYFSTNYEYYIIQCRTLKKDIEVLIKKGDNVRIQLQKDGIKIIIKNRITKNCEFEIDEILNSKNINPSELIKRYFNPLHYMTTEEANKFPNNKYKIKTKAFEEIPNCVNSAIHVIDSLQTMGLISDVTADFYRNKFNNQLLSLNILESKVNLDSCKIIMKQISNETNLYPDRYPYKLAQVIVDKFFVENAPKIKFNNFTNRNYCAIYDKLDRTNFFEIRYKHHLLERELDGIIHSFSKVTGKKYYDLFINSTSDTILIETVKSKHFSIFTTIENRMELLSLDQKKYSFTNVASKNKLTYFDYWASWCGPCRIEMPHSKRLEEKYREKGVNFIYISIDQDLTAWKRSSQQIGLSNSKSYLLINGNDSAISKKYKISTIPRYMIMDSKGQFINQDAPRPSDPKIRQIFDELLKNK